MKVIKIESLQTGTFIDRPNRYLAKIEINNEIHEVHVHDPGRLKELLYSGNEVLIKSVSNKKRKTKWDLIAAKKDNKYVLVNSMYHRYIAQKMLEKRFEKLQAEVKYNNSRIDFLGNEKTWIEVKGCTLSINGIALFPDAPTKRGTKHLNELIELKEKGYETEVYILVFSKAEVFSPNFKTDKLFAKTFYKAINKGVKVHPLLFEFQDEWIIYKKELDIMEEDKWII
ncbi:sugar fermentation stimulation protein [Marinitoga piezophila KA3]|uniref:Sugar fermentation stimulation protein homolog n=1 Tax=Marinitoga piezophila (strain DSM 14283 / JCM 11233 / KA3) TaxID=443254 RepID=H2J2P2_MARPK|nr:DNA/RNA nuclease SfsA [Marinitoga piezophila]AEX84486.1 sugar fermentation stimulation protein [Marinitoga piezophila KA3]